MKKSSHTRGGAHTSRTRTTSTNKQNPEMYDYTHCLNYEYYDEEIGYQCRYIFCPPCEEPEWPIDE